MTPHDSGNCGPYCVDCQMENFNLPVDGVVKDVIWEHLHLSWTQPRLMMIFMKQNLVKGQTVLSGGSNMGFLMQLEKE